MAKTLELQAELAAVASECMSIEEELNIVGELINEIKESQNAVSNGKAGSGPPSWTKDDGDLSGDDTARFCPHAIHKRLGNVGQ